MASSDLPPRVPTTSLFSSLLEQSRKLRQGTETGELPPIQLGLDEIERRAKELRKAPGGQRQTDARAHYLLAAGGINTDENLRDLDSIDFHTAYEPSTVRVDTDIDSYLRSRKEQNVRSSIEDGMRRTARDFDSFVAKNVTMEWEAQKQRIFEHFGLVPRSTALAATPEPRGTFSGGLSAFGASSFGRSRLGTSAGPGNKSQTGGVWSKSTLGNSVLGRSTSGTPAGGHQGGTFADIDPGRQLELSRQAQTRQQNFALAVKKMNEARSESGTAFGGISVMKTFGDITSESGSDLLTLQLHDSWRLLAQITGESDVEDANPFRGPRERAYVKDYILNTASDSQEAARVRRLVQSGSRKFLEKQYREVVEKAISENPQVAKVGGIPSVFHKFRGYINIKLVTNKDIPEWDIKNFDFVNEVPCWALVFYLIRAGYLEEANEFVRKNQQSFQKLDRSFPTYLAAYCSAGDERRLPRNLLDRIQAEYNNRVKHSEDTKDIFKPAVYKIIGRCELSKRSVPTVMPTAEDWMWLQLVLAKEIDRATDPAHEVFTLQDLQKGVIQFGARHFGTKGSNVGLYFQMLLMSGLFEDAVHYLYSFQSVDGVHFAIALTYYGLLRPTTNPAKADTDLLSLGATGEKQVNFPRLIGYYTRDFRTPNAEEAVDYLCLICLNGDLPPPTGQQHLAICHDALKELVLETAEFTKLLGDIRADGAREKGAIEKRMKLIKLADQQEYLRTITEQAATQAHDDGRATDAVLLYHLAEDYDTVMEVANKNLSDSIASEDDSPPFTYHPGAITPGSNASITSVDDPAQLATNMLTLYSGNAAIYSKISMRNREAVAVLLKIAEAKNRYREGKWESCLLIIEGVKVIPIEKGADIGAIRRQAQNFASLHETVARNVGILLKMAVECCSRLSAELRDSMFADANRTQKLNELRSRAKGVTIYTGMIQYKLPAHVYEFINSRDITEGF